MAVSTDHNERSSKRRKLSTLQEQQQDVPKISKTKPKSSVTKNSQNAGATADAQVSTKSNHHKAQELPSVKDLASSESSLRRAAMKAIISHLESRLPSNPLSSSECLQLWRGFWVAIYMHDSKNAVSVQNLLRDIAHTFAIISAKDDEAQRAQHGHDEASDSEMAQRRWLSTYHTAFHETMIREWSGIDSHRLNKALLIYRLVMRELFQICFSPLIKEASEEIPEKPTNPTSQKKTKKQISKEAEKTPRSTTGTDESQKAKALSSTTSIIRVLETSGPLNPSDRKIPDGLRLHVLDIWNDELFGTLDTFSQQNSSDDEDNRSAVRSPRDGLSAMLELLREPLEKMAKSDGGAQRHVRTRAKETMEVFDAKREEVTGE